MSEGGRYEKVPRPESVQAFVRFVSSNGFVTNVQQIKPQVYRITRRGRSDLLVFLTNIYVVGVADVHEIMATEPDLNAIITVSAWNGYSRDAKELCRSNKVGLFRFNEFLGAVHYDDKQFLDYVPPSEDEKRKDRRTRRY
jgi:hypothetical protein